jgi:hypothetical protein
MIRRLMTFQELADDMYLLEGMMIEMPLPKGKLFSGEVIRTEWWKNRHIRKIYIAEGRSWNRTTKEWGWVGGYLLQFKFEDFELFSGPYETDTDEIFFLYMNTIHVRFYHKQNNEELIGPETFMILHEQFMSSDNPKNAAE